MKWLALDIMMGTIALPEGVRFEQMSDATVDETVALLRTWYPDIVVGAESRHLQADFYRLESQLVESSADRNVYPLITRDTATGEIVAMMTLEKNEPGRQITSPMGAVEPSKRGVGIGQVGPAILESFGRAIGAEVAFYYATLKSARPQLNAEKHGFSPVGMVPGFDVDAIQTGVEKRVFEILYTKYLGAQALLEVPAWKNLTPKTRALYSFLFGKHPEDISEGELK